MRDLLMGVALAALLGASPALAKDKQPLKSEGAGQSSAMTDENANRLQNEDGTFQGKPVVKGPANWHSASSGSSGSSASSGGSTGEAGSTAR
ncbi:hypothetical protein [Hyphomicrobium sp.]|uniref:hypothetical protein n=1 Tax=Hyphomicrobium sp. TaxID=82 RepID=UPI002E363F6F|nr:hypothetical protein [Hyphomicrobium sp.]HEX2841085.1 hypothetical protein [Hyphomicrobium sp.]